MIYRKPFFFGLNNFKISEYIKEKFAHFLLIHRNLNNLLECMFYQ